MNPLDPDDAVELSIPVRADLVVLARLTAATVAGRAGFGLEDIEDLRLAVEELCLSLVSGASGGRLDLHFAVTDQTMSVTAALVGEAPGALEATDESELSLRILDALVDEHGRELVDGRPRAWMEKRRVSVLSDG